MSPSIFNGAVFRRWRQITFAIKNISRSNLLKTALYERELLLAANEEKERSMFERWKAALHGKRAQRVAPFPNLPRKDNNGENKATGTQSFI